METTEQKNETNQSKQGSNQGFITDVKIFLNESTQTLTHKVGQDLRIEMPINLYKKILGIPFTPKESSTDKSATVKTPYGLVAKPSIYLSNDGQYLIHRVLGVKISKHVNYYKKIFGIEFTSTVKAA